MLKSLLLTSALLLGCASDPVADRGDVAKPAEAPPAVVHHGQIRDIMQGDWQSNAALAERLDGPRVLALGALSELRGELLSVQGVTWLAYPTETALPRVVRTTMPDEDATLLVMAEVARWREQTLAADIAADAFETELRTLARSQGVDVTQPFPFMIRGRLRSVTWHVIDGTRVQPGMRPDQNAQHGTAVDAEGSVIGFYSDSHQGVFTMMGSNVHMHVVLDDGTVVGHVQALDLVRGTTVSFPE